jgi:hypothetical protein
MSRQALMILTFAIAVVAAPVLAQNPRPVRTFPEFVGRWILDPAASTGRMRMAPPPAQTLTIATTSTDITVTRVLDLPPPSRGGDRRMATNNPPPEVYRFDGTPTTQEEYPGSVAIHQQTFLLVADALALTRKRITGGAGDSGSFTAVTDALSVTGDVLTLHRQLTSVTAAGAIFTMQEPTNNFRHTYIYRRSR